MSGDETIFSSAVDDGLLMEPVGEWAEKKYSLVGLYDRLFSTGMKHKWDERVYVDLYAGPGKAVSRDGGRIFLGSPLLALNVPDKFDRYIFCEENPQKADALRQRIDSGFPRANSVVVKGDCNDRVEDIIEQIPRGSSSHKVLTFCFVDPYNLGIKLKTIQRLAERYVDFLVLLALHMDGGRNELRYAEENSSRIEQFLGDSEWRQSWDIVRRSGRSFRQFLADEYIKRMLVMKYLPASGSSTVLVRTSDRNVPLYHLAFFSRHHTAYRYWGDIQRYASDQQSLSFEEQ